VLIQTLLKQVGASEGAGDSGRLCSELECAHEGTIRWLLEAGLAPLLYSKLGPDLQRITAPLRDRLLGAELTARVRHGERVDAAIDVIELCIRAGVPVTLLKGISISEQHYSAGHLRPMTDIDMLIPEESYGAIESLLLARGYRHGIETIPEGSHHGAPLLHPKHDVWLELHTALFHGGSMFRKNDVFGPAHVTRESIESTFFDLPVRRLSDELQLAYVAAYWTEDLSSRRMHPSFLVPIFDAARIADTTHRSLDWPRVVDSIPNEAAKAALYLLLSCLRGSAGSDVPVAVTSRLSAEQGYLGASEARLMRWLIDRFLIAGRPLRLFNSWHVWVNMLEPGASVLKLARLPWRILFPPTNPQRFALQAQAGRLRRLGRRLGRK